MKDHTPTPWKYDPEGASIETQMPDLRNEYQHICDLSEYISGEVNHHDGEFICRAVNNHDALVKAVKDLLPLYESGIHEPWILEARAALADATKETP